MKKTRTTEAQLSKVPQYESPGPHRYRAFYLLLPSEIASLTNTRWENQEERQFIRTHRRYGRKS